MPMIEVYAGAAVFDDRKKLARRLAAAVMAVEEVPDIPMFRQLIASTPGAPPPPERIWVLPVDRGWRLWEHAHTNTELVQTARSQLAQTVETSTAAEA